MGIALDYRLLPPSRLRNRFVGLAQNRGSEALAEEARQRECSKAKSALRTLLLRTALVVISWNLKMEPIDIAQPAPFVVQEMVHMTQNRGKNGQDASRLL